MCQTEPEGIQGEPVLVTGSFQKDRIKFDGRDLLVQQVNASTVTSGGPGLERSYPYGSVYTKKTSKRTLLSPSHMRTLGTCILRPGNEAGNPGIANLVSQFYFGPATDAGGTQESYKEKCPDLCPPLVSQQLAEDTSANRLGWFREAVTDLATQLKERLQPPDRNSTRRVFFPYRIGSGRGKEAPDYPQVVREFAQQM